MSLERDGSLAARSGERTVHSRGPLLVRAAGRVEIGGNAYRGEALVRNGGDGLTAINVLDLEDYLLGVVPREIGRRTTAEVEAVKAQAVAARTYAITHMGGQAALGFDVFSGVQDQVYGGIADEDTVAGRAVLETRGEIITYDGVPIIAYYSSTCGGRTSAVEDAWPWRTPVPYLKSVSDLVPGTDSAWCASSNRFHWTAHWTRAQLLSALGASLRAYTHAAVALRRVDAIDITDTNASGRVSVRLQADGRSWTMRADSVRWVLRLPGGAGLNSARLAKLDVEKGEDGAVTALSVEGGGWGHGVGMCQMGALGRARGGQRYDQILRAYYSGTELKRIY